MKAWDRRGFTFHTNYESRKGRELAVNPWAAMLFDRDPARSPGPGRRAVWPGPPRPSPTPTSPPCSPGPSPARRPRPRASQSRAEGPRPKGREVAVDTRAHRRAPAVAAGSAYADCLRVLGDRRRPSPRPPPATSPMGTGGGWTVAATAAAPAAASPGRPFPGRLFPRPWGYRGCSDRGLLGRLGRVGFCRGPSVPGHPDTPELPNPEYPNTRVSEEDAMSESAVPCGHLDQAQAEPTPSSTGCEDCRPGHRAHRVDLRVCMECGHAGEVATARPPGTPPRTSRRPSHPQIESDEPARTGGGATWTRSPSRSRGRPASPTPGRRRPPPGSADLVELGRRTRRRRSPAPARGCGDERARGDGGHGPPGMSRGRRPFVSSARGPRPRSRWPVDGGTPRR